MGEYNLDGSTFDSVEKEMYIDPPVLPPDASEEDKLSAWKQWQEAESIKRRAHKAAFTKKIKGTVPDSEYNRSTVKIGGVYKQLNGSVGINGSDEDNSLEQIVAIPATQDRYFQARGARAGDKDQNRTRKRRKNQRKKAQLLLSQRNTP